MKIVLTGGPAAGKTSLVEILHRASDGRTVIAPEAATILYRGGFPRQLESGYIACQQRAIYHVQKELEEIANIDAQGRAVICDRGSLDGLAYWAGDEDSFFDGIGSSMIAEVGRYDWVIHLDTASASDYHTSEVRVEKVQEAVLLNEKVKQAWRFHPRRLIIPHTRDFIRKMHCAVNIVNSILEGDDINDIKLLLNLDVEAGEPKLTLEPTKD